MKSERRTRPGSTPNGPPWKWREGRVNKKRDHFELLYGESLGEWVPVAHVGFVRKGLVKVQFLIDKADPERPKIVEDVAKELNFYLAELRKPDPWHYLKYHCTTMSNVYGSVHWAFISEDGNRNVNPPLRLQFAHPAGQEKEKA